MISWFRRTSPPAPEQAPPDPDSPEILAAELADLIRMINRNAGRFPVAATVAARYVTDTVDAIVENIAEDTTPDVQAVISVRGIVRDYLPTTLTTFLALDPATTERPLPGGGTPAGHVVDQLNELWTAATDVLAAVRARDADALVTQGNFLTTKFTRSDLDL